VEKWGSKCRVVVVKFFLLNTVILVRKLIWQNMCVYIKQLAEKKLGKIRRRQNVCSYRLKIILSALVTLSTCKSNLKNH